MSETKHTPGPWQHQPAAGNHAFLIYSEATGRDLALVRNFDEANARLITAAPDLLKLLREVLEWNEDDADLATNDTAFRLKNFADTVACRSAALRAAIAKAEAR